MAGQRTKRYHGLVLAFYHKRDKLYRQLRHQINSSSQEKVLQYINYLIFEHTENVYFSKKIEEEIKNNKMIEKLSQEANGLPRFGHLSADNMFGIGYEAVKPEDIPTQKNRGCVLWESCHCHVRDSR